MGKRNVEYGDVRNGQLDGHYFSPVVCGQFLLYVNVFEQLKSEDVRVRKQAKIAAVICLAVALLLPAVYQLYFVNEMMR